MKGCLFAFISLLLLPLGYSAAQGAELAGKDEALGFEFGMSNKDALELIDRSGKRVIENAVDSKKMRTILFEGALVEPPLASPELNLKTRLEFWNKKLMSASLLFDEGTEELHERFMDGLRDYFLAHYGEPSSHDSFFNFRTWTWHLPNLKVVLSSNPAKHSTHILYTYKPLNTTKELQEYEELVRTPPPDPVKEYFLK